MRPQLILLLAALILLLSSCGKSPQVDGETDPQGVTVQDAKISAPGVTLLAYTVAAGSVDRVALEEGLQSAADALSSIYAESLRNNPKLEGNLRGSFQIEPDGTVRMFMQKDVELSGDGGTDVLNKFIRATFGKAYQFPVLDENVLVAVDFQLAPAEGLGNGSLR